MAKKTKTKTDNSDISKDLLEMLGGDEQLETVVQNKMMQDNKEKTIVELQMGFSLPPPIYGFHLTTKPEQANGTIKMVRELNRHPDGVEVVSVEGNRYVVSRASKIGRAHV